MPSRRNRPPTTSQSRLCHSHQARQAGTSRTSTRQARWRGRAPTERQVRRSSREHGRRRRTTTSSTPCARTGAHSTRSTTRWAEQSRASRFARQPAAARRMSPPPLTHLVSIAQHMRSHSNGCIVQPVITINKGWLVTIIFLLLQFVFVPMANAGCTYRVNSLGTTVYSCDGGQNGTLRTNSLGTMTDSVTGTRYRTDSLGTTRGSDGSTYRTDSLGTIRGNDGSSWRKDSLGTWRSNTGTTCRTNSLGTMRCD